MKFPRSPNEKVGGLVYFGRMLDKARLKAAGDLPPDLHQNLGTGFDKEMRGFPPGILRRIGKQGC